MLAWGQNTLNRYLVCLNTQLVSVPDIKLTLASLKSHSVEVKCKFVHKHTVSTLHGLVTPWLLKTLTHPGVQRAVIVFLEEMASHGIGETWSGWYLGFLIAVPSPEDFPGFRLIAAYEHSISNARQGPHPMLGATCSKAMATSATSDMDVSVIHELDDWGLFDGRPGISPTGHAHWVLAECHITWRSPPCSWRQRPRHHPPHCLL